MFESIYRGPLCHTILIGPLSASVSYFKQVVVLIDTTKSTIIPCIAYFVLLSARHKNRYTDSSGLMLPKGRHSKKQQGAPVEADSNSDGASHVTSRDLR